jgi:hypothetical protein
MVKSIPILLITALFLLPSPAQAITRRADKECLLCHVLWFDAFKTDQETLIEKRDSSIVIAGSVGLASSEEMCVTCHDGYVVDSRVKIVEGNPHYVLKKPPPRWEARRSCALATKGLRCVSVATMARLGGKDIAIIRF